MIIVLMIFINNNYFIFGKIGVKKAIHIMKKKIILYGKVLKKNLTLDI